MSNAYTYYFNDIFTKYKDWKDFITTTGIVDYNDTIQSNYDFYFYKLLSYHFSHQNIRYFEINSFLLELTNVYSNRFKQYMRKIQFAEKLYNLTEDEILYLEKSIIDNANTGITNLANNPNNDVAEPTQPLSYISNQTYSNGTGQSVDTKLKNKLDMFLKYIQNLPGLSAYEFISKRENEFDMSFKDLFMQVLPNQKYVYHKGGN